jgi:1,4-alpha-glucan branching enzyme
VVANKYGENKNLEAIEFFKHLNSMLRGRNTGHPDDRRGIHRLAEGDRRRGERRSGLLDEVEYGLDERLPEYMKLDPLFRKGNHYKMTFSTSYAYSEKYVLVLRMTRSST